MRRIESTRECLDSLVSAGRDRSVVVACMCVLLFFSNHLENGGRGNRSHGQIRFDLSHLVAQGEYVSKLPDQSNIHSRERLEKHVVSHHRTNRSWTSSGTFWNVHPKQSKRCRDAISLSIERSVFHHRNIRPRHR